MNKKLVWIAAAVAVYFLFFRKTVSAAPVQVPGTSRETEKPGKGPTSFPGQMATPKVGIGLDRVTRTTAGV